MTGPVQEILPIGYGPLFPRLPCLMPDVPPNRSLPSSGANTLQRDPGEVCHGFPCLLRFMVAGGNDHQPRSGTCDYCLTAVQGRQIPTLIPSISQPSIVFFADICCFCPFYRIFSPDELDGADIIDENGTKLIYKRRIGKTLYWHSLLTRMPVKPLP